MDIILNRRSVRKYDLTKKIDYDTLVELCRYAESAPSARRQASREYIIVDDKELINKLSTISKGAMLLTGCDSVIAVVGTNPQTLVTPRMQDQDLSAATQNILLQATKLGIGSCWIGVYPIEDRMIPAKEILGIEDERFVFSLIALGYPLNENSFYDAKKEVVIHHNRG